MITEDYPEATEALRVKTDGVLQALTEDDTSDDMFMHVVRECSEVCKLYDVPDEDRLDLIFDVFRQQAYEDIDQALDDVKWQLETMRSL